MSEPAVRLVDLVRRFGDVNAVDGVSLDIAEGEFFSLIGPSGCGKTTTLRMISGLDRPTSGRIEVRGTDVTRDPPHRRPVTTVFQSYALFPHLDVFENVAFGLRERRVAKDEVRRRVTRMLELVDLAGRERAKPRELSGGQQQRVAVARSLVLEPQVLLLDEPLGALDLKLRKQLQVLLKDVQREVGITFVYVTHDQEEAFSMSDRVAVMHRGRVEQVGRPREVYPEPASLFVAEFVGASNRLPAIVTEALPHGRYRADLGVLGEAVVSGVAGMTAGARAVAIVRPEHLRPGGGPIRITGSVLDAAYVGPSVQLTVETPLGALRAIGPGGRADVATATTLGWDPDDAWLLPAAPEAS